MMVYLDNLWDDTYMHDWSMATTDAVNKYQYVLNEILNQSNIPSIQFSDDITCNRQLINPA